MSAGVNSAVGGQKGGVEFTEDNAPDEDSFPPEEFQCVRNGALLLVT